MSKRYTLAALTLATTLLAAPAFADGKDGTRVNKGPAPLKARLCSDGSKGFYDSEGRFVCRTVQRTQVTRPKMVRVSAPPPAPTLNLTGLTGGVGATVGSGFYGGGGGLIIADSRGSYSGVLNAAASSFTFNRRTRRGGGGNGCGCQ